MAIKVSGPPDAPEYDHQDPENDGQNGRPCRHAPSYAPQTQVRRALRAEEAREFDRLNGSSGHPKALPHLRTITTSRDRDDEGTTGFNDGPDGSDGLRTKQGAWP